MAKMRVGILFGGQSAEHEVSLQSAANVFDAIDRQRFEPVLVGIDKNGNWLLEHPDNFLLNPDNPEQIALNNTGAPAALVPAAGGRLTPINGSGSLASVDVVFPILHGPRGEDGTVQGLLRLAGVPFVGSGVLGSAVGMDKDVMKRLLRDAGVPIGAFIALTDTEAIPSYADAAATLGEVIFVKPANMGSSVGVSKVHNAHEYAPAIAAAFAFDRKIVLEQFIPGRELECAVLGNDTPIASMPGEVKPTHEFYSYNAKYIDENGASLEIPANLPEETSNAVRALALKTFTTLCAEGLARVDFFLRNDGQIFVNEINTMPGFTKISMYPKLFEAAGISYTDLITRLIELALERSEREKRLQTGYR
jgi:D-alanine-D-alanine ligase